MSCFESKRRQTVTADRSFSFHFASTCLERGYSIIPVNPRAKTPAIPWKEYQDRHPSFGEVSCWFGAGTGHNLGVVTGRISDLVVVDVDAPSDAAFWRAERPETPLIVKTGGGGFHFYYRYPTSGSIGNRVRILNRSIDIRSDGGFVVAPPSISATGDAYQWLGSFEEYSLEEVPHFDIKWLGREAELSSDRFGANNQVTRNAIRDVASYIRRIRAISGQQGHNATFRVACLLREAGLSQQEAFDELTAWSKENAFPPWSEPELRHKIQSAFSKEQMP